MAKKLMKIQRREEVTEFQASDLLTHPSQVSREALGAHLDEPYSKPKPGSPNHYENRLIAAIDWNRSCERRTLAPALAEPLKKR